MTSQRTLELPRARRQVIGQLGRYEEPGWGGYVLNGRRLRLKDRVELMMPDGSWMPGLFGWSGRRGDAPMLFVAAGDAERSGVVGIGISSDAILRWPSREGP